MLLDGNACYEYENIDRDLRNENHTQCGCIRLYCSLLKRRGKVWNRTDRVSNLRDSVSPETWAVLQGLHTVFLLLSGQRGGCQYANEAAHINLAADI